MVNFRVMVKMYRTEDLTGTIGVTAPWTLVEEAIKGAQKIKPDPDFIIWTGEVLLTFCCICATRIKRNVFQSLFVCLFVCFFPPKKIL